MKYIYITFRVSKNDSAALRSILSECRGFEQVSPVHTFNPNGVVMMVNLLKDCGVALGGVGTFIAGLSSFLGMLNKLKNSGGEAAIRFKKRHVEHDITIDLDRLLEMTIDEVEALHLEHGESQGIDVFANIKADKDGRPKTR